jgi:hypothetical protein
MTEYQIQPNTRRCTATGRELRPGEKYYTVLREDGDHWVRQDYSAEAWPGPPAGAFSFWSGRVPAPESSQRPRFDDDTLLDCFNRLEGDLEPRKLSFRYVVALLLLRRKRFKFERTSFAEGCERLCLRCMRTGNQYQVIDPRLSESELGKVQEDVFQALGWQ